MRTSLLLAVASACVSTSVIAQTERDLDSHMHGAASMNVAIVDSSVFLEFNTPWNNLVGFEHAPSTDEQHAMVDDALKLLNNPDSLFTFVDGECALEKVELENSMAEDGDMHDDEHGHDDEHKDEHHDGDGHDDEHKDEHHDGDGHDDEHKDEHHDDEHKDEHKDSHKDEHHDDHDEGESSHSSVLAIYTYQCAQIGELDKIDLALFEHWSGLVDLDVQLVGNNGQTMLELNNQNTSLAVSEVR